MSLISWHSSRLKRVTRSSSEAETQAAADGDDEAVCIRLCSERGSACGSWICKTGNRKRDKFSMLWWWTVYDALARSSFSSLGVKDKKSGLEAHALKHSLVECGTMTRWCHSAALLGDVAVKGSDTARAPRELFPSWFSVESETRSQS